MVCWTSRLPVIRLIQPSRAALGGHPAFLTLVVLGLSLAAGCAHTEPFVWSQDLPASVASPPKDDLIAPGDLLSIRVWNQDAMSTKARVRNDGQISMPFLNDVQVSGKRPADLARELESRLRDYLNKPIVTVAIEETRPVTVSVLGEVGHTGNFTLNTGAGVLQALASAGGLNEYASKDWILVVRAGPPALRVRFTWDSLTHAVPSAVRFQLQDGDIILVK
jgi:polysaccharide export outer membrane protein